MPEKEREPQEKRKPILFLTRKIDEAIYLSPGTEREVEIKILEIGRTRVKVAIKAPLEIGIARDNVKKSPL